MQNRTNQDQTSTCLNCGSRLIGQYCADCGQSSKTDRLQVRTMLENVFEELTDFNRPLYRTLLGLTIRPGAVISEYVAGRRKSYTNPVKYCVMISALLIALIQFRGSIVEVASQTMSADPTAAAPAAEFLHQFNEINNVIQPYSHVISLALMPVLAGLLCLFFRKSSHSFADHLAFGCFAVGHLGILNIALLAFNLHRLAFNAVVFLINVGPPIYITWAAIVFNKNRFWPGLLRSLLAYGLFALFASLLTVLAVFVKMKGHMLG